MKLLSRVQLFMTPWTVGHQAPVSMGFPRQEYWSGLPFPSPGDLPDPEIEPRSPALQADALTSKPRGKPTHCLGGVNNQLTSNFTETRQVSYKALLYSIVLIVNIMYT